MASETILLLVVFKERFLGGHLRRDELRKIRQLDLRDTKTAFKADYPDLHQYISGIFRPKHI